MGWDTETKMSIYEKETEVMKKFSGIIPPVSSTFHRDGTLDKKAMREVADFLINKGVDGLFYLGTGGEFSQMNTAQRMALAEEAVTIVDGRVPVLIGVGSPSTDEAVKLAQHAQAYGADGIVAINPYYWKVAPRNLDDYYQQIARSVTLPGDPVQLSGSDGSGLNPGNRDASGSAKREYRWHQRHHRQRWSLAYDDQHS